MALNDGFTYLLTVADDEHARPLTAVLAARFSHSPAAIWATRLAGGEIDVDGRTECIDGPVRRGQRVTWRRPPWNEPDVPLAFDVLHEDADLVAVDKPSGLPTMPAGGFLAHTLLTRVRARFGWVAPLHRLGRHTSGVVAFARHADAAAALAAAWREHRVTKSYRALVDGSPPWDTRTIETPIGPVPHAPLGTVFAASPAGRASRSDVTVRERRRDTTLCDVRITTGRPHQIRIHLASVGWPLAGDPLYVAGGGPRADGTAVPGDGGYHLHALQLTLPHPRDGHALTLRAPAPDALRMASEHVR